MAEIKHLSPGALPPAENHILVRRLPRSGGFEISFSAKVAEKSFGFDRQRVDGDIAAAIRVAEDWAARSGVDVIYLMVQSES